MAKKVHLKIPVIHENLIFSTSQTHNFFFFLLSFSVEYKESGCNCSQVSKGASFPDIGFCQIQQFGLHNSKNAARLFLQNQHRRHHFSLKLNHFLATFSKLNLYFERKDNIIANSLINSQSLTFNTVVSMKIIRPYREDDRMRCIYAVSNQKQELAKATYLLLNFDSGSIEGSNFLFKIQQIKGQFFQMKYINLSHIIH